MTGLAALGVLTLLGRAPQPRALALQGPTFRCITLSQRELAFRRSHAFVCLDGGGTMLGALLRRNGTILCSLTGDIDGAGCVTIRFCGVVQHACEGGG